MTKGIFIFRRDFRLDDNLALLDLTKKCEQIIPIFIFDPYQIDETKDNAHYISHPAIQFMIESLRDLDQELKAKHGSQLLLYHGKPSSVIEELLQADKNIKCVALNADFSPYSRTRDQAIQQVCRRYNVECTMNELDLLLHPINAVLSDDGPVKVFGFYRKRAMALGVDEPQKFTKRPFLPEAALRQYETKSILQNKVDKFIKKPRKQQPGGRRKALEILANVRDKDFNQYNSKRDLLHYDTTHLLKFGTISIREAHAAFKNAGSQGSDLVKQLYWRTWFFVRSYYRETLSPDSDGGYGHIEERFRDLPWVSGKEYERRGSLLWEKAQTGFPVIDAAIRQLNQTGWMHNRARLLVANFAVKILKLNPFAATSGKDGKWSCQESFSRKLLDCCHANNYGNWMWILGPYDTSGYRYGQKNTFGGRTFKTIVEFKKFDPELKYVRKWIPELAKVSDKDIWNWDTSHTRHKNIKYPKPIVDFASELEEWYDMTTK
jgi:deoxyribodipyrimidine photo-lyase